MVPVTQLTTATDTSTLTSPGEVVHEADSPDAPWWRDAVIYQVYPRSWADADGDGIGDLPGITARLPLPARPRRRRRLALARSTSRRWPTPATTSPTTATSTRVFGSLADADAMVARAHELGLKVIVDLVPNHTLRRARLVPGRAGRRPRLARSASATSSATGTGRARRAAAEQLAVGLRRPRLDPGHRGRRHARPVVPAHLRHQAARPQLGAPRGARRVPRHPAVLAATGASTASASTSRTAWSRSRACPTGRQVGATTMLGTPSTTARG